MSSIEKDAFSRISNCEKLTVTLRNLQKCDKNSLQNLLADLVVSIDNDVELYVDARLYRDAVNEFITKAIDRNLPLCSKAEYSKICELQITIFQQLNCLPSNGPSAAMCSDRVKQGNPKLQQIVLIQHSQANSIPEDPPIQNQLKNLALKNEPQKNEPSAPENRNCSKNDTFRYIFTDFEDLDQQNNINRNGSFGFILKGKHPAFGSGFVAVKRFHKPIVNLKSDAYREIENSRKHRDHPSLVRFYGIVYENMESNVIVGLIMEYIEKSLQDVIFGLEHKYTLGQAIRWMIDLTSCMAYLHRNTLIHRDLNPKNLLIKWDDNRKPLFVCDLGSSKIIPQDVAMTDQTGTPLYSSPELLNRSGDYSKPTDVYSCGKIVWAILHRIDLEPFYDLKAIVRNSERLPFDEIIPPQLIDFVKRCIRFNPDDRYNMDECKEKLEKLLAENPEWEKVIVLHSAIIQ